MFTNLEPNTVYEANHKFVSIAEQGVDTEILRGISFRGFGHGGESLLFMRAVPWNTYVNLEWELRELVHANTKLIIEPPVGWQNYIIAHVTAFLEHDNWLVKVLENSVDTPDYSWEIEPYWSDYEKARIPADIDSIYEKFEQLEEEVIFEHVSPGNIYLAHNSPAVYTGTEIGGHQGCIKLKLNKMEPVKYENPDEILILPLEETEDLNQDEFRKMEEDESIWIQSSDDRYQNVVRLLQLFYLAYTRPYSISTMVATMRLYNDDEELLNRFLQFTKNYNL